MEILTILRWVITHWRIAVKAALVAAVGLLLAWGINTHKENKKLTEQLEMALNNVEAYLGALNGSLLAYNVIKLDMKELSQQNDKLLHQLDSVRKLLKIKEKELHMAATQTQLVDVTQLKEVTGDEDLPTMLLYTTYTDSILYNPLTKVRYTISKDTVSIGIDIKNTLYLFLYDKREYKNKKSFIKRLFTLDFKKVTKYRYKIENTNDLVNTEDVRIVEQTDK